MFEHRSQSILPWWKFVVRQLWHLAVCCGLVAISLLIGTVGYHLFDAQGWVEAAYSATMVLTAMGPSGNPKTDGGKVFAICYALFSSIIFITMVTVLITPTAHRLLHTLHADEKDLTPEKQGKK